MVERNTFNYSYSAKQQEEIRQIRQKYVAKEESALERLRRLDKSAAKPGTIISITVGILGVLVFGLGMCCVTVWAERLFIPGILIGSAGIAGMICAYPLYNRITKKRREKLAPEIIRLTDALINPEGNPVK